MNKARAKIKSIVTDIAAIIAVIIPAILKKKPFCLWYQGIDEKWILKGGPFSHRQCVKTREALISLGTYIPDRFLILRKGVSP